MKKIILDLCGGTGSWSKSYKDNGYDVINVTLPICDVRSFYPPKDVYGILAAPPCDQFSFAKTTGCWRDLRRGMEVVEACLKIIWSCQYPIDKPYSKKCPLKFWALENPNCMLKYFLGKPAFEFNPYDFGNNYKKKTHLWGWFNEPKKKPIKCNKPKFDRLKTKEIHPEFYGKLTRTERRAVTPSGFAQAFYESNR